MKFEKRSGDEAETPSSAPEETPSTGKKPVVIYIMILFIVAFLLLDLQNQLDEAQSTIDALESSAEETDAALAEAQRENQALLALYTIQQQYSAGDLAGCQASIDAFEASEYRDALPETAEEGVTPPSQRYAQLKEAAEAR